ncbi:uncharacterized protein troap isoform X2 [Danio aesculapii]|uniref:uncharacterized protein troap isoform X2 n=1 Tax=Danio aesculapii TaxID=1142201 RepID=UPI0024C08EA9|nr:uncharacterized protein troap isoform X2 [Danio aesculapii]
MASLNPLRAQNRSQQDQTGILKSQDLKTKASASSFKRGSENLDPSASAEAGKVVSKLKGVSRLPVLAKSLHPALSELSQNPNDNKWEQRPLAGKAQKKKTCTKPVPFNLSQSRTRIQKSTDLSQGKPPLMPSARLTTVEKLRDVNAGAKTDTQSHKATTPGVIRTQANQSPRLQSFNNAQYKGSTDGHGCYNHTDLSSRLDCIHLAQSKHPEHSSHLSKTSLSKVDVNSENQAPKDKHCFQTVPSTVQSHVSCKGSSQKLSSAVHNVFSREGLSAVGAQCMMPRLSTCPSGPGTSNNLPQRVLKKTHHGIDATADKAGLFSPDPSALRSILQSDGTRLAEHTGASPRVSTCPTGRGTSIYSAQRVPVRKPQTEVSTAVKAPAGSAVSFSPDPAALRSILLNEGVRAGGATPSRVSVCPTGRGTSIYSVILIRGIQIPVLCYNKGALNHVTFYLSQAQRVPVKKNRQEVMVTAAVSSQCANRTPVMKWTPQRVTNTKPQSMRKPCTTQKMSSLRDSPGLLGSHDPSPGILICQEGENVVQRLFEDKEQMDDDQTDQNGITSQQLLNSHQSVETQSTVRENSDSVLHTKNESKKTAQPFIQAAHRGSVIVFSSSQRLVSEQSQDTLKTLAANLQLCEDRPTSHNAAQSNGSQINPSIDMTKQSQSKAIIQSSAVSALRRRQTPLEEMFLDEECATYTSRLLSCPLQPRSGNPVASTLLFQDSTCFLPIGLSSPVRLSPVLSFGSIRA